WRARRHGRARVLPGIVGEAGGDGPAALRRRGHGRRPDADRGRGLRRGGGLHRERAQRPRRRTHARPARSGPVDRVRARDSLARARHARAQRRGAAAVIPLQSVVIALVAVGALAVVLTRDLVRLTMIASLYALTLVVFV